MRFPHKWSRVILQCSIIGYVATGSIPGDLHNKPLHSKRQNTPPTWGLGTGAGRSHYSWEQSWKTENNNNVTTVTTATSGILPPRTGFDQGTARTWSYQYSYTSSSENTKTEKAHEAISRNGSNADAHPTKASPKPGSQKKPVYSSPKPAPTVSTPKVVGSPGTGSGDHQTQSGHTKTQPGYTSTQPGYTNTQPGYTNTQPGYTKIIPTYNSTRIGLTPSSGRLPISTGSGNNTSAGTAGSEIQKWLDLHNNYRSQYGVASVTWSEDLVPTAKIQTQKCVWKHTKPNKYGENIAAGQYSVSDVVVAWVEGPNEREVWNPQAATPTHFTQVVWKKTRQIGCASKTCQSVEGSNLPQSPIVLWACEYYPKGNVQGEYTQNVLAATGGKALTSASTLATVSVDPNDPYSTNADSKSSTIYY